MKRGPNEFKETTNGANQGYGRTPRKLGQTANVPSTVMRAIEQGNDVPLSQFNAVVAALGLTIELVEQT